MNIARFQFRSSFARCCAAAVTAVVCSALPWSLFAAEQKPLLSTPQVKTEPTPPRIIDNKFESAPAGTYWLDPLHARLVFYAEHYGGLSRPFLRFKVLRATYHWDPKQPQATKITAEIEQTSIDSGNRDFDVRINEKDGLRGYDADSGTLAPPIKFESTQVKFTKGTQGILTGNMTFLGVTRPITMDFTYNGFIGNAGASHQNQKMGFSARGTLNRSDWGMTYPGEYSVGNEVTFMMELEFFRSREGDKPKAAAR